MTLCNMIWLENLNYFLINYFVAQERSRNSLHCVHCAPKAINLQKRINVHSNTKLKRKHLGLQFLILNN